MFRIVIRPFLEHLQSLIRFALEEWTNREFRREGLGQAIASRDRPIPFIRAIVPHKIRQRPQPKSIREHASGKRPRLGQAIGQLLDNAIVAPGKNGKILVDVGRTADGARIVISDNGSGMGKQELARLLEGLRVNENGKVERREGLGVPLARQLVEAHGGKLTLESKKGVGTTALIMLP